MILLVIAGGALGSVARFVVDSEITSRWGKSFPLGTFVINVSGSLVMGLVAGAVLFHDAPQWIQVVIGAGLCGGYTTFSTASLETVRLVRQRRALAGLITMCGTMTGAVGACAVGMYVVAAL